MKILFIVPGSGDSFYCGNCFRDNLQATALRRAGHEVIIMPLYLPLTDDSFQADTPLFFPAASFYAEQRFFNKKGLPKWMKRFLDSGWVLKMASSFSGSTSAKGSEGMTLAMITGKDHAFNKEVNTLVTWIKEQEKPDIIHLSSTLLIGVARAIRRELDTPVVCSLQDEEVWINSLDKKYADQAWQGIKENIPFVNHFVTTSEFYKQIAQQQIPQLKEIDVIYPGMVREKYASDEYPDTPVIGFFYRMNEANGLHMLAEAFVQLKKKNVIPGLKLKVAGGYTAQDKPFLKRVQKILKSCMEDVEFSYSYSLKEHIKFYKEISLICVPITFEEGVGLYLCEAFAAGRPTVEPAAGSFPEIVGKAGVLYQPVTSKALAEALEKILTDKELYNRSVKEALHLSETRYNDEVLAERLSRLYKQLLND